MNHYDYLIIGGGLAGDAAARGIRELDAQGTIGMLSAETDPPYTRPMLSKGLWKGKPLEKIWRNTQALGLDLQLGRKVIRLDPLKKAAADDKGGEYTFDKALIATGGTPARLPIGDDTIVYFRDLQDYRHLRALSEVGSNFLVIGGGFIGTELAAALKSIGKTVTLVLRDQAIEAGMFPADLGNYVNDYYRQKGVDVLTGAEVSGIEKREGRITVTLKGGRRLEVDGVVAGIGIKPNLELAQQSGLKLDDGILVDEHLQTSAADIFAAGDVANFFHVALGKRMRVEHEDNAIQMGKAAGRNMAGAGEAYTHASMFYSDLFELGYEAVGELNSGTQTVSDWQEPFQKGVVYYLADGRVRGVLLWNVWKQVDAARTLLAQAGPFKPADLMGRISEKPAEDQKSKLAT
jgi:NADPH-dependent 2,4-dienoyl-CoA reductase/sulfur reductase-like enzyme